MIQIEGLGRNLQNQMIMYHQKEVIKKLEQAACEGKTKCKVSSIGITYDFLDQLEDEGISYSKQEGKFIFMWDGVEV